MLKRILVAVDKSDMAQRAIAEAIALAKAQGAELRLIHVLTDDEPGSPPKLLYNQQQQYIVPPQAVLEQYQHTWNHFVDDWWKSLQWQVQEIQAEGLVGSCDMLQGRPGREICQAAKVWRADLIVMGSRGLSTPQELLLGSVSHYVSHRAPCSVWMTHRRRPARKGQRETEATHKSLTAAL